MTPFYPTIPFRRSALSLALCAALLPALTHAQDDDEDAAPVRSVVSSYSLGATGVSGTAQDRAQFNQYGDFGINGNLVGTLGFDYSLRDQGANQWLEVHGSDLLNHQRELSLVDKAPGQSKWTLNYSELTRNEPYSVNSGLIGAGSTSPTLNPVAAGNGAEIDLKTTRSAVGLGYTRIVNPTLQWQLDFKSEDKTGDRLFGLGVLCSPLFAASCNASNLSTLAVVPEPVNSNHSQIEARLTYTKDKLHLNAGYYGSFYRNSDASMALNAPGVVGNNPVLALAPSNQANQIDVGGNYAFTGSTQGTFKLAYAQATQSANFAGDGFTNAPAGVSNLAAVVNTTLADLGLSAHPAPKLSLLAKVHWEDRDDATPLANYDLSANGAASNRALSSQKLDAKLQAAWQFNANYRGSLGANYESIQRSNFTPTAVAYGVTALRANTEETSVNAELRRRLASNMSGSISLLSSQRTGSDWLVPGANGTGLTDVSNAQLPANGIYMPTLADRQRNAVKGFINWEVSKDFSLQFNAQSGVDNFNVPSAYGVQQAGTQALGVDASYAVNYAWNITGYLQQDVQTVNQARPGGYIMAFTDTDLTLGLGFTGKLGSKWDVGGSYAMTDNRSVYSQGADGSTDAYNKALLANGGLPGTLYHKDALKLFGKYALDKASMLRLDLVYQQLQYSDWAWAAPYQMTDGSTVNQSASQNITFVGVSYVHQLK